MARLVKRLLYKHEGVGSIPRTDIKKKKDNGAWTCVLIILVLGCADREIPVAHWLPNLA